MARPLHPAGLLHRRSFLHAGVLGALSKVLFPLSRTFAQGPGTVSSKYGKARSVILIFNGGAPSHIDLWDPKPDAPLEIRSTFRPIATDVDGLRITELLPRMAKRMRKLALIRSVHHEHSSHNAGMHWANVGRPYRVDSTLIHPSRSDLPGVGTLVGWLAQRDGFACEVPPLCHHPVPDLRQQGLHHPRAGRCLPRPEVRSVRVG